MRFVPFLLTSLLLPIWPEVLQELKGAIDAGKEVNTLTSRFYTVIPHSFGRMVPPPIKTHEGVQEKMDMLNMLADIEVAQRLLDTSKPKAEVKEVEHPLDGT